MSTKHTDTASDGGTEHEHTQADFAIGDVVEDREADTDGDPVVVNLPPVTADDWDAYRTYDDRYVTVAEDNPSYDADSEVVVVMFDDDLDRWGEWSGAEPIPLAQAPGGTYAFPAGRLEPTGEKYGENDDSEPEPVEETSTEDETLRERLDAIADSVRELNVDDVAVDTFREAVVVEKLGKEYRIDTDGTVDADDLLAGKLENAIDGNGDDSQ